MGALQLLPVELIDCILSLLAKPDLLALRLAGKHISRLATILVFSSITTLYTENSLDNLKKISESANLTRHVKAFEYRFMGIYDIPMSFTQLKAWIASPGYSYHGLPLGETHSHYVEQFESHKSILSSRKDHQTLCSAFQQFCNLRSVSLRAADQKQYPYWQETWASPLKNLPLGGELAYRNITHAIRARHELCYELSQNDDHPRPFTEITFFSAITLPPLFSKVPLEYPHQFEFNPLDTSSRGGLANITTLKLHLRAPRRYKYQAHQADKPLPKYWSTEQLARALSLLRNLKNLHLSVEESREHGARFLENPLQGSWESLRVVIVSGWEFTEEDLIGFAERHAQTLRSLFVGYLSLLVHKDEQAYDVFFRVWGKLRDMKLECLLDGPFYWGPRVRGSGSETTEIPINLSCHLAEGLRRRKRVLEDSLFSRP